MSGQLHPDERQHILDAAAGVLDAAPPHEALLAAIADDEQGIEIMPDGTIVGGGVPHILTRRADLGGDY